MLAIRDLNTNLYFCKDHEQVILFDNMNDINFFVNSFLSYSISRAMKEDPRLVFEVMELKSSLTIDDVPNDTETKTVLFSDLKKK